MGKKQVVKRQIANKPDFESQACNSYEVRIHELVFIRVYGSDGISFEVLLTRVPCIGEAIIQKNNTYKITAVQHFALDIYGRASAGWNAVVDADFYPEIFEPTRKEKKSMLAKTPHLDV